MENGGMIWVGSTQACALPDSVIYSYASEEGLI